MTTKKKKAQDEAFDPIAMIQDSIVKGFDASVIQEIDERDLNWCPNVATWILDKDYLGIDTIYPVQLQTMLKLFGDVCPHCSDWGYYQQDFEVTASIGNVLDKIQLLEFGKCPKCDTTRSDHYKTGHWYFPDELDLCWGMRSGKSAVVGMISSYVLHRFLKIPDPASYFKLLEGSLLVMRFVALTAGQAQESIWHQFTRAVESCTWFQQYHDFLRQHEKRLGVELVKNMTQYMAYNHKKLSAYYLGASIDTSRGRTAFFTAFDEIGWWLGSDAAKRANAPETYAAYEKASRTIRNSAMSRFTRGSYDVPTALLCAVSSTSSKTDHIMHLIRQAKTDKKKVASHKASWEVNPAFAENPDELRSERERNPKTFLRDYGSIPPFADDPFIDNEETVMKCIRVERPLWMVEHLESEVGSYLSAELFEKDKTIPYCLAIDIGKTNSGYAAALLKLNPTDFSCVQIAGLFALYPQRGRNIDLSLMFNKFVKVLCEKLHIQLVLYDQWQSKAQIDELKNMGIQSEEYSLTYQDFLNFRTQVLQMKLEMPPTEITLQQAENSAEALEDVLYSKPYLHFLWQMLSVSEIGNKITKGDGHDDLFRAVVLGTNYLWHEDWREQFEYRPGMGFTGYRRGSGKGRLVMAGGGRSSGQMFNMATTSSGNNAIVASAPGSRRALGVIVPRGKG